MMKISPEKRGRRAIARFIAARSGVAAIEFAFILPVLVLLLFGSIEASEMLTVKRRVVNAGNALVDLISQEPTITKAEVDDAIAGVRRLLEPTDTSTLSVNVVSVIKGDQAGDPVTVHWSLDEKGDEAYGPGATYSKLGDNKSVRPEASLVVVEMDFNYVSSLGGRIFSKQMRFVSQTKRWPRKSARVELCANADRTGCTG